MPIGISSLISIVIPNYNREEFITQTLVSLQKQSYPFWEAIVVDDHSTDNSLVVVEEMAQIDSRIRFYRRDRMPKGAPACRNIGVEMSKGEFVIFLDSDDILAPYCLSNRVNAFNENGAFDFLVFPMLLFKKVPGDSNQLWGNYTGDALSQFLTSGSPWQTTCPIWKRSSLSLVGGWDEEVLTWQDWDFHINALVSGLKYKIITSLPDCFLRRDDHDRISAGDMRVERLDAKYKLFLKVYNLLERQGILKDSFRKAFAGLFFNHAERAAIKWPKNEMAFLFVKQIRKLHLLPLGTYRLSFVYIFLLSWTKRVKLSVITSLVYKTAQFILPNFLLRRNGKIKASPAILDEVELSKIRSIMSNGNV